MASPLPTAKQSVDLAAPGARRSRIRRDPPPVEKEVSAAEQGEREAWEVVIGIIAFALALAAITIGISNAIGWSPRQYTANV